MVNHWKFSVVMLSACIAVALSSSIVSADLQSGPRVSESVVKPLKAAQTAISQKKYDEALAQVKEAQAVPAQKSAYDNYVINVMLIQIYQGNSDSANLIATLGSAALSQYATADQQRTWYKYIAQYEYQHRDYDKALDAARHAIGHGETDNDTTNLIAQAQRWRTEEFRSRTSERIWQTRPRRRDAPLRYLNISDDEVREIQLAVTANPPYDFVSISGVVTGCPVEEGPACTDQVWVDVHRQGRTHGLLLSKVNNQWVIGLIQQWYLCDEDLDGNRKSFASYSAYMAAKDALVDHFPSCVSQPMVTVKQ